MAKINILLIEDNRLLRENITILLSDYSSDFIVIAQSGEDDAVDQLKKVSFTPDVVLLDLGLEKIRSLELMALLQDELPEAKIIAMDILPDYVDVVEFVRAGGSGFILKNATLDDWVNTIRTVATGTKVLPPILTQSLFTQIVDMVIKNKKEIPMDSIKFTNREREVVTLIAEGLTNKEIAQRLYIATHTVKSHVHNILEKLAFNNRLQIAVFARSEKD